MTVLVAKKYEWFFKEIYPTKKVYAVCGGIWKTIDDKPT